MIGIYMRDARMKPNRCTPGKFTVPRSLNAGDHQDLPTIELLRIPPTHKHAAIKT